MGVNPTDTGINIRGSEFSGDMVGRPADEWRQVQFDRVFPQEEQEGSGPFSVQHLATWKFLVSRQKTPAGPVNG